MKTKLFTLFLAIMATNSLWAKFQYGNLYYEKISNNTAKVVGYLSPTSITIPSIVQYNGVQYTVTEIGEKAFNDCSSLTSVTIPNSVTSIGDDAFNDCSSLTSVTIGNSVTKIGGEAFKNCSSLTKTNYTGDIASWCNIKFYDYSANPINYSHNFYINDQEIKDLVIPNSVTSIGPDAFLNCSSLTSVTIENGVTSIGDDAFYGCSSLTSVTIGNSVTKIGRWAFENCSSLTKTNYTGDIASWCNIKFYDYSANPINYSHNFYINDQEIKDLVIPNSVTSIGPDAFLNCSSLTSVTIENGVTKIGGEAFKNCSSLTSVVIGNSVASIGDYAFSGCSGLTSLAIGNSVTEIGFGAFYNCSSLTSVTIPNSVGIIEAYAFKKCTSLNKVVCEAVLVPTTNSYAFEDVPISSAVLYVPDEAIDIYKYMKPWSEFSMILPISQLPSGVENVQTSIIDASKTKIIRDGQVVILHNDKSYNVMGQEM